MKKRLSARRHRHRSNQSEGFSEKKHRQDISLDRIRHGGWGGGRDSGCRYQPRPPKYNNTDQLMERKRGDLQYRRYRTGRCQKQHRGQQHRKILDWIAKFFCNRAYKSCVRVDFTAEWALKEREKQGLIQNWPRRDQSHSLHMQINDIKSGKILKYLNNSLLWFSFFFLFFFVSGWHVAWETVFFGCFFSVVARNQSL